MFYVGLILCGCGVPSCCECSSSVSGFQWAKTIAQSRYIHPGFCKTVVSICNHNHITSLYKKIIIITTFSQLLLTADTQTHKRRTNGSAQWCPQPQTCAIQRGNSLQLPRGSLLYTASHCMSWRSTWGSSSLSSAAHVTRSGCRGLHSTCSSCNKGGEWWVCCHNHLYKLFIYIHVFIFTLNNMMFVDKERYFSRLYKC